MFYNDWRHSINPKTFDDVDLFLFFNFRFTTILSYAFGTWFFILLKCALFVSDIYTCIKLLAFNTWSNSIIKPYLSFSISRWLFSGCILASIVLLIWEIISGIRAYRTRNIALCYINNFSRNIYSMTSYQKFCIFNKISAKRFFQKTSFFVYFEIRGCIRLIFADTPRQVINGLTLWSVLITTREDYDLGDLESIQGFAKKIKMIAETNKEEAILLTFMFLSFILWAFFITKFICAVICSPFVYFALIKESKYGSLREYVCMSISDHIDNLIVKQHRKKLGEENQKATLLSYSESSIELSDLEANVSAEYIFNGSYNGPNTSFSTNIHPAKILPENDCMKDSEIDILAKPVRITSAIIDVNGYDSAPNRPYIRKLQNNNSQYSIDSLETNINGSSTSLLFGQRDKNKPYRPRPPNSNMGGQSNLANSQQTHIFTPNKAYFREDDKDNNDYEQLIKHEY